ncbi:hypothetical protein AURDEDRAFT_169970 [Auricularia subglabra TFB-10046 SS5]|uniref:F-box domain-containing protein n=1 Tax=Auricularia subglabra (strain TFB-10046 / SS5) TaxID=717982 RepID=J0DD35_AURST|nr:hypothetical protein AURDEDRAFT_169970 [Auricularia subglabra TFB-10046 SS5]
MASPPNKWNRLRVLLALSDPDPIEAHVSLDADPLDREAGLEILGTILSRAASLRLHTYNYRLGPPSVDDWFCISSVLCKPAPFLKTLLLHRYECLTPICRDADADVLRMPLNPSILAGQPSDLRTCCLRGVILPVGGCPAFSMLTTFDYHRVDRRLRSTHLLDVLRNMPRLKILGLSLARFKDDRATKKRPFEHHSLTRISTRTVRRGMPKVGPRLLPFLAQLGVPTLSAFDLGYSEVDWDAIMKYAGRPVTLRVSADRWGEIFDMVIEPHCQLWLRSHCDSYDLGGFPASLFARLASIIIHESIWDVDRVPPSAPVLLRLQVVFHHGPVTPNYSGLAGGWPRSAWHCPQLECVEFSFARSGEARKAAFLPRVPVAADSEAVHDDCTGHGTIALSDISAFIRTAVRFDAPRLRMVRLYGVSAVVDPDPAAEFIALHDMTDSIETFTCVSPESSGMFDFYNAFTVPPAEIFDPSVPSLNMPGM